jgi:hypothetical protein
MSRSRFIVLRWNLPKTENIKNRKGDEIMQENNKMRKIIAEDLEGKGVVGQPDTPGLDRKEMQEKIEEISREVIIPAINDNVEAFEAHDGDNTRHIIASERAAWNGHNNDNTRHITSSERVAWNGHNGDNVRHITVGERAGWNAKAEQSDFEAIRNNTLNIASEGGGFKAGAGAVSANTAVVIGANARAIDSGVAIGSKTVEYGAGVTIGDEAQGMDGVAIGHGASSNTIFGPSIAIGNFAISEAGNSIQLGWGTNTEANSLQVYNYQLLDANGHIPVERIPQIGQMPTALAAILGV